VEGFGWGVDAFGGGVGVAAITGVLERGWLGAGEAGALKLSTSNASPSGLLITMAALFRAGLAKAGDGAGFAFGCGV
jgi:hypothetical protein